MPLVRCANCGNEVEPQKPKLGCLWAIFWFIIGIIPGIIYIIWNRSKPATICPACGHNAYRGRRKVKSEQGIYKSGPKARGSGQQVKRKDSDWGDVHFD